MKKTLIAVAASLCLVAAVAAAQPKGAAATAAPGAKWVITALADAKWMPFDPKNPKGVQISVVQGDPTKGPHSLLMKLPVGFKSGVHAHTSDYSAVALVGAPAHGDAEADAKVMAVGSTWVQPGKQHHFDSCTGATECISFVSMGGASDFIPAAPPPPEKKK